MTQVIRKHYSKSRMSEIFDHLAKAALLTYPHSIKTQLEGMVITAMAEERSNGLVGVIKVESSDDAIYYGRPEYVLSLLATYRADIIKSSEETSE